MFKMMLLAIAIAFSFQVHADYAHDEFKGSCMAMSKSRVKSKKITAEKQKAACECEAKVAASDCGSKCSTPDAVAIYMLDIPKATQAKLKECWK